MSKNKLIVNRWGSVYTDEHVEKLYDAVKRKSSVDFDLHIFNDHDDERWNDAQRTHFRGLDDPDQRAQGAWNDYERDDCGGMTHYRKLLMFRDDTDEQWYWDQENEKDVFFKHFNEDDTLLYLDLDSIIMGDVSYFFDLDNTKPWIVKSYWFDHGIGEEWKRQYHLRRCPLFNSSVMVWKPGQNRKIFDEVNKNLDKTFFTYGPNDNFLFHRFGPWALNKESREHFNVFEEGYITTEEHVGRFGMRKSIVHMLNGLTMKDKNEELCL